MGDALRHTWALRRLFRIGRGASERRSHAGAWER
ncbi:DUF1534 domain-containing protein [Pseudomonas congelans]|nr:DUF1534 domain-containing protein [Pseudomonas congelans]